MAQSQNGRTGTRGTARSARASYSLRLACFYGALFLILGVHLPYLPVWLDVRGLTAVEIAVVTAAPLFLRVFITPTAAMVADRTGRHRTLINALAWLALLLALGLAQMHGFWPILIFAVPLAIAFSTIIPLTETIAVAGVRAHGLDYGRMRLWGSISFIAAAFAGGIIVGQYGESSVIWMVVASTGALLAAAWFLPGRRRGGGASDEGVHGALTLKQVTEVAGSSTFLLFTCGVGLIQASHALFYAFGVLHWQAQGISSTAVGVLWSIGVLAEVVLFATAGRFIDAIGPLGFILGAGVAAVVRWGLMAFDPPLALLFPLQVLHAFTFGATHFGAMHFIHRAVPQEQAGTAQSLVAAATGGLGMGAATLLSGVLYDSIAGRGYLAMAAIGGIGLIATIALKRRWRD